MTQDTDNVYVSDMSTFVKAMIAWHAQKVAEFEHMTKVPKGIEVTVDDKESFILDGDLHTGFVMGVTMALVGISDLPFSVEYESEEEESPATDEPVQH